MDSKSIFFFSLFYFDLATAKSTLKMLLKVRNQRS